MKRQGGLVHRGMIHDLSCVYPSSLIFKNAHCVTDQSSASSAEISMSLLFLDASEALEGIDLKQQSWTRRPSWETWMNFAAAWNNRRIATVRFRLIKMFLLSCGTRLFSPKFIGFPIGF